LPNKRNGLKRAKPAGSVAKITWGFLREPSGDALRIKEMKKNAA
jgi:hypothetical protein